MIATEIVNVLSAKHLSQVQTVATDTPSGELLETFRIIMPKLQMLTVELTHVMFLYESAPGKRQTEGSQVPKQIQAKRRKITDGVAPVDVANVSVAMRSRPASRAPS